MEVFGKKIDLAYTLKVYEYLCKCCPDGNIKNLGQYITGDGSPEEMRKVFSLACEMNKAAYQRALCTEGVPIAEWPHYEPIDQMFDAMAFAEYADLYKAVFDTIRRDSTKNVDVVEVNDNSPKKESAEEVSVQNG